MSFQGALECVTKEAEQYIEKTGIKVRTEVIQKTAIVRNYKDIEKGSRNLRLVVLACFREELTRNFSCDKTNIIMETSYIFNKI